MFELIFTNNNQNNSKDICNIQLPKVEKLGLIARFKGVVGNDEIISGQGSIWQNDNPFPQLTLHSSEGLESWVGHTGCLVYIAANPILYRVPMIGLSFHYDNYGDTASTQVLLTSLSIN
jgi:hypothetical protein